MTNSDWQLSSLFLVTGRVFFLQSDQYGGNHSSSTGSSDMLLNAFILYIHSQPNMA
jgi:hypothetical protein